MEITSFIQRDISLRTSCAKRSREATEGNLRGLTAPPHLPPRPPVRFAHNHEKILVALSMFRSDPSPIMVLPLYEVITQKIAEKTEWISILLNHIKNPLLPPLKTGISAFSQSQCVCLCTCLLKNWTSTEQKFKQLGRNMCYGESRSDLWPWPLTLRVELMAARRTQFTVVYCCKH